MQEIIRTNTAKNSPMFSVEADQKNSSKKTSFDEVYKKTHEALKRKKENAVDKKSKAASTDKKSSAKSKQKSKEKTDVVNKKAKNTKNVEKSDKRNSTQKSGNVKNERELSEEELKLKKLNELLEQLGIEISDEVLEELSMTLEGKALLQKLMNLGKMVDKISAPTETELPVILEKIQVDTKALKNMIKALKADVENNSNNKNVEELLSRLNGKLEKVQQVLKSSNDMNEIKEKMAQLTMDKSYENTAETVQVKKSMEEKKITSVDKEHATEFSSEEKELKVKAKVEKNETASEFSKNKENPLLDDLAKTLGKTQANKGTNHSAKVFKEEMDFKLMTRVEKMKSLFNQVKNQISTKVTDKGTEILMSLKPKSLGKVELKLSIEKNEVIAKMNVESVIVKQALESNLQDLKNALSDKGYNLDQLDVSVGDEEQQEGHQQGYESIFAETLEDELMEDSESISNLTALINRNRLSYLG